MRGLSRTSDLGLCLVGWSLRDARLAIVAWRPCYWRNICLRNELVIFAVDTGDLTGDSR